MEEEEEEEEEEKLLLPATESSHTHAADTHVHLFT